MKHLFLILVLLVSGYGVWQFAPRKERDKFAKVASHHGFRLGALIAIVLLLVAAAVYFPATALL